MSELPDDVVLGPGEFLVPVYHTVPVVVGKKYKVELDDCCVGAYFIGTLMEIIDGNSGAYRFDNGYVEYGARLEEVEDEQAQGGRVHDA